MQVGRVWGRDPMFVIIRKAGRWRIDAFKLWCWRRLLRVPWTERRSNQSILKEISLGCSLEGLMLKLKLQYLVYLIRRADSFEKTMMLGKIEGGRKRGWQRMTEDEMPPTRWAWVWVSSGVGDGHGLACCNPWGCKELDTTEWLNWSHFHTWYLENSSLDYRDLYWQSDV